MPKSKIQEAKNFIQTLKEENVEEIYLSPPTSTPKILQNQKGSASTTTGTGKREQLLKLRESALKCVLCDELASTRKSVVFGAGNVNARLVFVGEAPGRDEDAQGLPFVGRAGQLLTKIIESIGLSRQDAFICNTLKCRPPANRQPHPQEIINCNPFLAGQIDIIKPQIICALGTFAAQTLLRTTTPISQLRGKFHDYRGIKVVCTFHPAYLLRNPEEKRKVWEDMKTIKRELDSLGS